MPVAVVVEASCCCCCRRVLCTIYHSVFLIVVFLVWRYLAEWVSHFETMQAMEKKLIYASDGTVGVGRAAYSSSKAKGLSSFELPGKPAIRLDGVNDKYLDWWGFFFRPMPSNERTHTQNTSWHHSSVFVVEFFFQGFPFQCETRVRRAHDSEQYTRGKQASYIAWKTKHRQQRNHSNGYNGRSNMLKQCARCQIGILNEVKKNLIVSNGSRNMVNMNIEMSIHNIRSSKRIVWSRMYSNIFSSCNL